MQTNPVYAEYTINRPVTINGVQFKAGDRLPTDSPLRKTSGRIDLLVKQRVLTLHVRPVVAQTTHQLQGAQQSNADANGGAKQNQRPSKVGG